MGKLKKSVRLHLKSNSSRRTTLFFFKIHCLLFKHPECFCFVGRIITPVVCRVFCIMCKGYLLLTMADCFLLLLDSTTTFGVLVRNIIEIKCFCLYTQSRKKTHFSPATVLIQTVGGWWASEFSLQWTEAACAYQVSTPGLIFLKCIAALEFHQSKIKINVWI